MDLQLFTHRVKEDSPQSGKQLSDRMQKLLESKIMEKYWQDTRACNGTKLVEDKVMSSCDLPKIDPLSSIPFRPAIIFEL